MSDPISANMSVPLLTRRQAAERMGVSVRTIERLDRSGDPNWPGFSRVSDRAVRYDPVKIDAFVASRSHPHRAAEMARSTPATILAGAS